MLSAPSLQSHSIPPRITEKSCRLRVSNRTMVGVLEPPRFACVASGPKASNHQTMKPSNRYRRLPWSVRSMSRTQSLSRSQIGLDANHHIHRLSEGTEGKSFLDIPSRLPWSVRSMSRTQSLPRSQIGLDANHHIHRLSERTEGKSFLDISSHRTHRSRSGVLGQ